MVLGRHEATLIQFAQKFDWEASVRQVKEIGFDLVLPGQPSSPLKPRKSGRARKTPQPDILLPNPQHSTPKQAGKRAQSIPLRMQELGSDALGGNEGDEDILNSNPSAGHGEPVNTKKRRHEGGKDTEEPVMKKKHKPSQNPRKERNVAVQTNKSRKPKATARAPKLETSKQTADVTINEAAKDDKPVSASEPVETLKALKQGPKASKFWSEPAKPGKRSEKPANRKRGEEAKAPPGAADHVSQGQQDVAAQKPTQAAAPVKKRKKRISIGQQSMGRVKRPPRRSPQKTIISKPTQETSDLVNELLDSTINSSPEKLNREAKQDEKPVETAKAQFGQNGQRPAVKGSDPVPDAQDSSTAVEPATVIPKQPTMTKLRRSKKRRSITQVKRPRKRAAISRNTPEEELPQEPDAEAGPHIVTPPSKPAPTRQGRKPLANISNSIADLTLAQTDDKLIEASNENPAPVKKRGRPRKNPVSEETEASLSRNAVEKPTVKPRPKPASSTKPSAVPRKAAKASTEPRKASQAKDPITVHIPNHKFPDDPDLDSDDPLSGASTIRPFTKRRVSTHGPAKVPAGILKKKANRPESRAEGREATPLRKILEDEKWKEVEQREIEELLGSIGKAVKRGRAMAAGGT